MIVPKNVQFSIVVKLDGRMREINFRKRGEFVYDGDATDDFNKRWSFKWHLEQNQWQMEPDIKDLPSWLTNNANLIRESFLTEFL